MNNIEKSINDTREYKWIELENKLKVIIISDNTNKNCGALLNIHVGSIHDTIPGMAHFLEHMVFMGSKKYPNVTNFFDNVSKYGGNTNAMTSDTDTTYYFTVNENYFFNVLDMFADFFVSPLLRKDNIDKEINAIDSESTKNLLSESWISFEMVKKCLFDDHPINHYTCGTKDTLNVKNNDKLMLDFFEKYYSANLMNLVLFVNNKFDDKKILTFLNETFSKIRNNNINLNEKYGNMIKPNQMLYYIPHIDDDILQICTEIPVLFKNLSDNPIDLLFWILTSKTKNSLYDVLKNLEYINDIRCDTIFNYDDYMLCIVEFNLTKKGYKNVNNIIQIYFEYVQSIKTSKNLESIYNDLCKYHSLLYKFPKHDDIIETLIHFNFLLNNKLEPANLLNYLINLPKYDDIKLIIDDTFGKIRLYNSSIIICSQNIDLKKYKIDDIYKIKYNIFNIDPIKINKGAYEIISCNKYIDDDINLIDEKYESMPIKINKKYNLFYNFNRNFNVPDVNIYILIDLKKIYKHTQTYLYFILYINTLIEDNIHTINEIKQAGYYLNFSLNMESLYIYINGNNKNIYDIVENLKNIFKNSTGTNFKMMYDLLYKYLNNFINLPVINKINQLINKKLYKKYYIPYDLLKYMNNKIKFDDCKNNFFDIVKSYGILSLLISGNINKDNVEKIGDKIYDIFDFENINKPSFKSNLKHVETPYICTYYNYNNNEKNCFFTLIYKLFTIKKNSDKKYADKIIFLMLLNLITNSEYFNIFRTEKQYGYVVYTKISYIGNKNLKIGCLKFIIQSSIKNSFDLYNETCSYIKNKLFESIENLGEEGLNEYKDGLLSSLTNKFTNLSELDIELCSHIFDYSYDFTYKEKLIKSIHDMDFKKFKAMFIDLIINNNDIYSISINPNIDSAKDNNKFF